MLLGFVAVVDLPNEKVARRECSVAVLDARGTEFSVLVVACKPADFCA